MFQLNGADVTMKSRPNDSVAEALAAADLSKVKDSPTSTYIHLSP